MEGVGFGWFADGAHVILNARGPSGRERGYPLDDAGAKPVAPVVQRSLKEGHAVGAGSDGTLPLLPWLNANISPVRAQGTASS